MRGAMRRCCLVGIAGLLPVLAAAAPPGAVPDTLEQRVAACTSCHGRHGEGGDNGFNPRLAGKPAGYLYHQLVNFRDGLRRYPMMRHMVTGLPDDYLREMAAFFASQSPAFPPPVASPLPEAVLERGRELAVEGDRGLGVPACTSCHGKRLTGREPAIPGLVGLPPDYIGSQLGAWRNGSRRAAAPDCMAQVARRLSRQDIHVVAAWLAARPAPDDATPAPASSTPLPMHCGSVEK